jgi:hypothetical protein
MHINNNLCAYTNDKNDNRLTGCVERDSINKQSNARSYDWRTNKQPTKTLLDYEYYIKTTRIHVLY